jgi:hypothetical protein
VQALAIDPQTSPGTLYAGTNGGRLLDALGTQNRVVFQSKDGGNLWDGVGSERNGLTTPDVQALAVDPTTIPSTLYAGTLGGGVFKGNILAPNAPDPIGRIRWDTFNTGLTNLDIRALAIHPAAPATIYAGTNGGGVFKRITSDASWATTSLTTGDVRALVIDSSEPSRLYAGTNGNGIFKSTDSGVNWIAINNGLTALAIQALAIDPVVPATIFAGTDGGGVFRSTDGGLTWTPVNTGLIDNDGQPVTVIQALAVDPEASTTLRAGTNGNAKGVYGQGMFTSTNGGESWSAAPDPYYGGAYKALSGVEFGVFLGCYSEAGQGYGSELAHPTLVLGGDLGGGFGPTTDASLITTMVPPLDGITRLPIRSMVIHAVRTIVRTDTLPSPNSFQLEAIALDDSVTFADAANGNLLVLLPRIAPPNTDITGRQYTVKRVDANPNGTTAALRGTDAPIDDQPPGSDVIINPLSGVTVMAHGPTWKIVGRF